MIDTSLALGFIGLGVMGLPMCRNLAKKSGCQVFAFDQDADRVSSLSDVGVKACAELRDLVAQSDIIFMALPSGKQVDLVCRMERGLIDGAMPGQVIVDLGTTPVQLTRDIASEFAQANVKYIDAPIARTRHAAVDGTLSIMVGASDADFALIEPYLLCMGEEINHCGDTGCGQVVKIMNNMVLFQTVNALSEAFAIAEKNGVPNAKLAEFFEIASADSFALRNHAKKAIIPKEFPEQAFSVMYALKDTAYALQLADQSSIFAGGAENLCKVLEQAAEAGHGDNYFPIISQLIGPGVGGETV